MRKTLLMTFSAEEKSSMTGNEGTDHCQPFHERSKAVRNVSPVPSCVGARQICLNNLHPAIGDAFDQCIEGDSAYQDGEVSPIRRIESAFLGWCPTRKMSEDRNSGGQPLSEWEKKFEEYAESHRVAQMEEWRRHVEAAISERSIIPSLPATI
jgi:hypothetical protein